MRAEFVSLSVNATAIRDSGAESLFYLIYAIEIIFIVYFLVTQHIMLLIVLRNANFHTNFNVIHAYPFILHSFNNFARVYMILYELQILPATEDEMYAMPSLHVANFIRVFTILIVVLTIPSIMLERIAATAFIGDYERRRRLYVGISLLVVETLAGLGISFVYIYGRAFTLYVLLFCTSTSVCCVFAYVYIRKVNIRLQKSYAQRRGSTGYSLSERFQLNENILSLKFIRKTVLTAVALNVILLPLFLIPLIWNPKSVFPSQMAYALRDAAMAMYSPVIFAVTAHEVPTWRDEFRRQLRRCMCECCCTRAEVDVEMPELPVRASPKEEQRIYFELLEKFWNSHD